MHLVPSIFISNSQSLLEKTLPETASIGFIGITRFAAALVDYLVELAQSFGPNPLIK
jgi:hypothetical protein